MMEAMAYDIPIIAVPMRFEQPLNARVVQQAGVGEEVKRDSNGRLQVAHIAKVIQKFVVDKDEDEIRRNTKAARDNVDKYVDIVVTELNKLCNI